jgi:hypothetical protein
MHGSIPNHPEYEMTRSSALRNALLAACLALVGCLQTDPAGKGPDEPASTGIQDVGQLAGATSTTNWPNDDGGRVLWRVMGVADTVISLTFTGDEGTHVPAAGSFTVYEFGTIPALDSVRRIQIPFGLADTVRLSPSAILHFFQNGRDTLRFSLGIAADNSEGSRCLLVGFTYSVKDGRFLASPLANHRDFRMSRSGFSFRGPTDTSLSKIGPSFPGNKQWCFYIPGSPYFWMVDPDSVLDIGPVPLGNYPLRLLRIIPEEGRQEKRRMEIIALQFEKVFVPGGDSYSRIQAGETLLSIDVPASLSLRPQ